MSAATDYKPGDRVECRTARGTWFPAVATTGVRNVKYGRVYKLAVAITGGDWTEVNWPIEDVRHAAEAAISREGRSDG